jgi:pantetheine-phosphate adenylyltransferase
MPARALRHALFPGTFDPVTLGHLDLIRRAAQLFPRLTVAVAEHHSKRELLPYGMRLELLREVTRGIAGCSVERLEGLVVDGARALGCDVIVRGARGTSDFDYEAQMARTNRMLSDGIETVVLVSSPEHVHVSSTLARQVALMGGPLEGLVPEPVARALRATVSPTHSERP